MGEELTTCEECENDLTIDGSVVMKYVIAVPGKLDSEGQPMSHTMEEIQADLNSFQLDSMECAECSEVIGFH